VTDTRLTAFDVGGHTLQLCQPTVLEDDPPDRISLWWGLTTSSVALARQLLEGPSLHGERVIELGCGLGLAGIAAARQGAHVTFSDYQPKALEFAAARAAANGLPPTRYTTLLMDWEDAGSAGPYDRILGAEVAYDYFFHDALLSVIEGTLASDGVVTLVDRKRLVVERFIGRMRQSGFDCRQTATTVDVPGLVTQEVTFYQLGQVRKTR